MSAFLIVTYVLLGYAYGNAKVLFKLIREGRKRSLEEKKQQEEGVRQMVVQYCSNNVDRRRTQLLGYFGQKFSAKECKGGCDKRLRNAEVVEEDLTEAAKNVVDLT